MQYSEAVLSTPQPPNNPSPCPLRSAVLGVPMAQEGRSHARHVGIVMVFSLLAWQPVLGFVVLPASYVMQRHPAKGLWGRGCSRLQHEVWVGATWTPVLSRCICTLIRRCLDATQGSCSLIATSCFATHGLTNCSSIDMRLISCTWRIRGICERGVVEHQHVLSRTRVLVVAKSFVAGACCCWPLVLVQAYTDTC